MTDFLGSKLFDRSSLMDATFRNLKNLAIAICCSVTSVNNIIMNLADFEMGDNVYGITVF